MDHHRRGDSEYFRNLWHDDRKISILVPRLSLSTRLLEAEVVEECGSNVCLLPDFKPKRTRYDPHSQKEHTEILKIPKFGVNQARFD